MASQSNVALNTRSMNGIITLSDGAGTTISNGAVTTSVLNVPFIPRTNQPETAISGLWNYTTLPTSSLIATNSNQFITKGYYDPIDITNVKLSGSQTLTTGIKTFQNLPQSTAVPSVAADITNKSYVDSLDGNNVKLTGNQTISGIKTFNSLPQSTAVPSMAENLTTKSYVDGLDQSNVKLTGNQLINGNIGFNEGIGINTNKYIQMDSNNATNFISNGSIITYTANASHNFTTSTSSTKISDGVYCEKLAVGLATKAKTFLNYANIANIITGSITLLSASNTSLDSLYLVSMPVSAPVIITLPTVDNQNLGTALSFYKNTSPSASLYLQAVSGNQIYFDDGASFQAFQFSNSVGFIKVVAIKNGSTFGWIIVNGKDLTYPTFQSVSVVTNVHIQTGKLFLGLTTNICEIYNTYASNVSSLIINSNPPSVMLDQGVLDLRTNNVTSALLTFQGVIIPTNLSLGFGTGTASNFLTFGYMRMSSDGFKLELRKGTFGGASAGIDFYINTTAIMSLLPQSVSIKVPYLLFPTATGASNIVASSSALLLQSNHSVANSNITFQCNNTNIASISTAGLSMVGNKPIFLSANSAFATNATDIYIQSYNGVNSGIRLQCDAVDTIYLSNNGLQVKSGYYCKAVVTPTNFGNRFNFNWNGANMETWVDSVFVGYISLFSDYRIKENLSYAEKPVLERLCSLKLFEYETKEIGIFKPSGKHYGFYAHELQEAFPELDNIITGEKDKVNDNGEIVPQTVNMEITNLYLRAIQELNSLVKNLTERCDKQAEQIDILNKKLGLN